MLLLSKKKKKQVLEADFVSVLISTVYNSREQVTKPSQNVSAPDKQDFNAVCSMFKRLIICLNCIVSE
jgi:hypothetical protein